MPGHNPNPGRSVSSEPLPFRALRISWSRDGPALALHFFDEPTLLLDFRWSIRDGRSSRLMPHGPEQGLSSGK